MKHFKLAKFLANALGLALLTAPATMVFAGCNKSVNKGVDLYSVDIQDFNGVDLANYYDAITYQSQLASIQSDDTKCLSAEKAEAYSNVMYSIGNEFAQRRFVFNNIDENGKKINDLNDDISSLPTLIKTCLLSACINFEIYKDGMSYTLLTYNEFIEYYGKDKIDAILDSSDYVSEKDFVDGYVSLLNGYFDNAKDYVLSNYTRYEDLTDEQINEIIMALNSSIASTARDYFNRNKSSFYKYKNAVSYDQIGELAIPTAYLVNNTRVGIGKVIESVVDNFYPTDLMYFEQPIVDYWQECIDPLFQEAFGYTWTDCVKLTEDPDLHPIGWFNYDIYFALIGMTEDDIPMPTIS